MFEFRCNEGCEPKYMSAHSAAADLVARCGLKVEPGQRVKVPTGVWIEKVRFDDVPEGMIPEIQIRARSGLSFKKGLTLCNGVGTVDADFPDEICVLLVNLSHETVTIEQGERVAQMACNLLHRFPGLDGSGKRTGGFGSTGNI
jgi:dUTP pyrophosphatase